MPIGDLSTCNNVRAELRLLDDLIGMGEQRRRDVDADRLCGLEIDDRVEPPD